MIVRERGERNIRRVRYQIIQRGSPWICESSRNRDHDLRQYLRDVIMGVGGRLQYHEMGRGRSIGGIGSNLFTVAIPGFGLFTDKLQDLRPSTAESAS